MDYLDESYAGDCDDIKNYQTVTAEDKKDIDTNGWFEVKDNPLSKEGVFLYRGAQITLPDGSKPADLNQLYPVYRPAEELEQSIESFKLIPWIDEHTMLGGEELGMTPAERKGVSGVVGEDVYFKDGTLYGNIKVFSEKFARQIENGKKELSLGYRCSYEYNPGVWNGQKYDYIQRDLKGNHLALVEKGRMGADVRVMDGDDTEMHYDRIIFSCDSLENKQMTLKELLENAAKQMGETASLLTKAAELADGDGQDDQNEEVGTPPANTEPADEPASTPADNSEEGADDGDDVLSKLLDVVERLDARIAKLEGGNAEGQDLLDANINATGVSNSNDNEEQKTEGANAMDAAEIARQVTMRINKRDAMYKQVSAFTGAFNVAAMDSAEAVAAYACKKLKLNAEKGQEIAMMTGYMANRKPASQQPQVAMDSKHTAQGKSFLDGQINK